MVETWGDLRVGIILEVFTGMKTLRLLTKLISFLSISDIAATENVSPFGRTCSLFKQNIVSQSIPRFLLASTLLLAGCATAQKAEVSSRTSGTNTGIVLSIKFPSSLASRDCMLEIWGERNRYKVSFSDIQSHPSFVAMEPDIYALKKIKCSVVPFMAEEQYTIDSDFFKDLSVRKNSISIVLPVIMSFTDEGHLLLKQDRKFQQKALDKLYSSTSDSDALISAYNEGVIKKSFYKDGSRIPSIEASFQRPGLSLNLYSEIAMQCYEQEVGKNILPLGRDSINWSRVKQTITIESVNSKQPLNNYSQKYIECIHKVVAGVKNESNIQSLTIRF